MRRIWIYSFFMAVVLVVACGGDNSTSTNNPSAGPTITGMTPSTVSPGQQNVSGSITGSNFTGSVTVNLGDGITVSQATAASTSQISVVFSVNSNATSGARVITVTASGGTATSGNIFSVKVSAPVAEFTAIEDQDIVGKYTFDASLSTGNGATINQFSWQFADGARDNGKKVIHQFIKDGTYAVTLKVTSANGADTATKSFNVQLPKNCGYTDKCTFWNPQYFTIVAVDGPPNAATITSDRDIAKCARCCPELRRLDVLPGHNAESEFLGDVVEGSFTCRTLKLRVYGLRSYVPPKVGEKVYLVYKNS